MNALLELVTGLTLKNDHGRAAFLAGAAALTADDTVLDIGCGPGVGLVEISARGATAIGLDPSPTMLWLAARRLKSTPAILLRSGVDAIPLPCGSVTVAWASASFHHWPDAASGLAEARRVLAPGGRLLILERSTSGHGLIGSHGLSHTDAADLSSLLDDHGFTNATVETVSVAGHHYALARASADVEVGDDAVVVGRP
jgi:ubiquinone/menaquinone biosynthesis C-methylase UbiE